MSNEKENFLNLLQRKLPNDFHKLSMVATLVGMCGILVEHINKTETTEPLPEIVQYAMIMAAANILALTSDGECSFTDLSNGEGYNMSEQTQETIYRTMKKIVIDLYAEVMNDEQINTIR
jgi:hypothetical protein